MSGDISTFLSRLHSLGDGQTAIDGYISENASFASIIDVNFQEKINKELKYLKFRFYQKPLMLLEVNVSDNNIIDSDYVPILDSEGFIIEKTV